MKNKEILKLKEGLLKRKNSSLTHGCLFYTTMSCTEAIPVECRKRIKHTKKTDLPDTRQEESQLWINGQLTTVTKLKHTYSTKMNH